MVNDLVAVTAGVEVSVTCTVMVAVAAVLGVPLMTPVLLRESPYGSSPEDRDQV
jgi:hypothetical protein